MSEAPKQKLDLTSTFANKDEVEEKLATLGISMDDYEWRSHSGKDYLYVKDAHSFIVSPDYPGNGLRFTPNAVRSFTPPEPTYNSLESTNVSSVFEIKNRYRFDFHICQQRRS